MKNSRKLMVASNEKYNRHMFNEMSKELGIVSPELFNKKAFGNKSLTNSLRQTENRTDINK